MTQQLNPQELVGTTVYDIEDSKVGKVGNVYLNDDTGRPEWATVKTGLFGHKESFVPLQGANLDSDGVHVRAAKNAITEAPQVEHGGHLSPQEGSELYQHYHLAAPAAGAPGRGSDSQGKHATGEHRQTDSGSDQAMVRSEERLRVGTEQVETGKVRLRKYVVTEQQQVSVPVSHEEVRVEREPVAEGERTAGARIGEDEQEVTLHAEKPVVQKETVPVEKVSLGTEQVTEEQTVADEVRKEEIEVDDDSRHRRGDR